MAKTPITPAKFALRMGYRSYLMTAHEAATVMDILARAVCTERDWVDDNGAVLVPAEPESISMTVVTETLLTREEAEARRAAYKAEQEAKAAAAD